MDDFKRELAGLKERIRLLTLSMLGALVIAVMAGGGADAVARTLVEAPAWKVSTKNLAGTTRDRLTVTTDVNDARVILTETNLELAKLQTSAPFAANQAEGVLWYDDTNNTLKYSNGTAWVDAGAGASGTDYVCQGRLTLTTGVPVTTSNVTSSTVYFTPYLGNRISLYNGIGWTTWTYTERSLNIAALATTTNFDIFLYDNGGTLTLEAVAWSTTTTRAVALVLQDGIRVKSGATGRRFLGTIRTSAAGTCADSETQRFVANYYNRKVRRLKVTEPADNWLTPATGWRKWNGNAANRVDFISNGEDGIQLSFWGAAAGGGGGTGNNGYDVVVGIGLNADTPATDSVYAGALAQAAGNRQTPHAIYCGIPVEGSHYLQLLEYSNTTLTGWYGDNATSNKLAGAIGWVMQ